MDTVKIGKEKLRLSDLWDKQCEIVKEFQREMLNANDQLQHTSRLMEMIEKEPEKYLELLENQKKEDDKIKKFKL